ncbi:hypothetical protein PBI_QUEENHAZEL_35 [Mycobacterium phage QueenHazel]|uniref:DUF732 domain-containing protein n=1 Tax=Mycobacterium phage Xula TaxID=2599884 RepID=A0A5J6TME5_9CAUD|nr:hypothetical protein KNU73_gp34 [Mycobacterium phage Xula]QFG11107.1 hypothetical protein PBI_XULA_34 [Mycobacterium phage Xula]QFG15043.1 hypothetical protein PBI_QUEENHAZEL_35 [Mycobacterium phage QueenHazel]
MSTNSLPSNARPIWTPADYRETVAAAAKHQPQRVRLRDWIWAPLLIVAGILGAGLVAAPNAQADIVSDAFILALDSEGITYASESAAINAGHAVCDYMDTGASIYSASVLVYQNSHLDLYDAGYFVGAATAAFCPEHAPSNTGIA